MEKVVGTIEEVWIFSGVEVLDEGLYLIFKKYHIVCICKIETSE